MNSNWAVRTRPARLERRIEFSDYDQTRQFLDRAAELAKTHGNYPDMSFSRTQVSITLYPQAPDDEVNEGLLHYAGLIDALAIDSAKVQ